MSNPVLNQNVFSRSASTDYSAESMTVNGTLSKSILLIILVLAGAAYTWKIFYEAINPASVSPWMWGGLIVGFICAMIISFKPKTSTYLAPVYSVAEGMALGGISAIVNASFAATMPNIVINAVAITMITALVMFLVYRTGIIKVNGRFMKIMSVAMMSIMLFYLGTIILSLFGVSTALVTGFNPLSIVINLIIVGVAAFSLLMNS